MFLLQQRYTKIIFFFVPSGVEWFESIFETPSLRPTGKADRHSKDVHYRLKKIYSLFWTIKKVKVVSQVALKFVQSTFGLNTELFSSCTCGSLNDAVLVSCNKQNIKSLEFELHMHRLCTYAIQL